MQYGNKSVLDELKYQYNYGGIVIQLVIVNVALFLIGWLVEIVQWGAQIDDVATSWIQKWLWLPSDLSHFIITPYTLFTYQFLHSGFFHILFNMLILFWFGKILTGFISSKKVLPLYLMGGIAGGIFYLLMYNIVPALQSEYGVLVGASASIMAILAATAYLVPDMEIRLFFVLRLKLKYLTAALVLINIFTVQTGGNAGGNIAHLGGFAFGFLFIYLIQNHGIDLSKPWNKAFDYIVGLFEKQTTPRVTFRNPNPPKKEKKSAFNTTDQEKVDAILDKIAQNGYDSLTKAEKEYLFQASKDNK